MGSIRPVILAGGLGTRLRPRTLLLPKPLLPIDGRPLLWYVLEAVNLGGLLPPIVTLDYKAELIQSYFDGARATFLTLPDVTMAEAFLTAAASDDASAFLGLSSDVVFPRGLIDSLVRMHTECANEDVALFTKLAEPGHKKWRFVVQDERLKDVVREDVNTNEERVAMILSRETVQYCRNRLPRPVAEAGIPPELRGFQTGWTLLLKTLATGGRDIHARVVELPIHNLNVPGDFESAREFVRAQEL
ncbi:MAG: NTP transferase domain-containing protein [Thermoanaerobaculia bacterium]|nr:NTP transferase domain-containing protein [Thermoanaerobaculia bacterium]